MYERDGDRMEIMTKLFGEISIDDSKLISFPKGIVGFPDLNQFALVHDSEEGSSSALSFLLSMDEPAFAIPVVDPLLVKADYNPVIEDDLLAPLGELVGEDTIVLVTMTVPHDLTKMTVNLMAPIIINAKERVGVQVILNDAEGSPVKYPVYDILQKAKEEALAREKGEAK